MKMNEIEKENPNFYAIIPAVVRYDKRVMANAKLLYGEITALCNKNGYCWAGNRYFSSLYKTSNRSIQTWIKQLIKCGYIKVEMVDLSKRKIFLLHGGMKKTSRGYEENFIHNSTYNTTSINTLNFSKEKLLLKTKNNKKMDDRDIIEVDEDGNEKVGKWGKKKDGVKKEPKNQVAIWLVKEFYKIAEKEIGIEPIPVAGKHYFAVINAMNKGKLDKKQILDLFDWWFGKRDIPDTRLISLTACLSANSIDSYKVENM